MSVVFQAQVGPVRAVLHAEGPALAMFDAKLRNTIVRQSLAAGGQFWVDVFLPKRFSTYSRTLGYVVSARWREEKERYVGVAVPFVGLTPPGGGPVHPRWKQQNGEKMITAALAGARVQATAAGSRATITIRIPYGHAIKDYFAEYFRFVPSWEYQRVAEVIAEALSRFLDGLLPPGSTPSPRRQRQIPRALGPALPSRAVVIPRKVA